MNSAQSPVLIVGAGPAGTSAALALRNRNIPVHIIDAGTDNITPPPQGHFLDLRFHDYEQWRWQIGAAKQDLLVSASASPKFRVPGLRSIFDGYAEANHLESIKGFHLTGALAAGGLSNAWGCGVSRFDRNELGPIAIDEVAMGESYTRVARRMGLSGSSQDALSNYFGLDDISAPPLPLDSLHQLLWRRRERVKGKLRLGRARVAVLNEVKAGREPCDLSGMCLWGCRRRATWSAAYDLETLRKDAGVRYEAGVKVETLRPRPDGGWDLEARTATGVHLYSARDVLLAAGTLATTRLVLGALPQGPTEVALQSNPMAAFLLCVPKMLGKPRESAFGLAQLSYALDLSIEASAFGNLFATTGIPVSEFLAHLPISRRAGLPLLRSLLPSCTVGNLFLPGELSAHSAKLLTNGTMRITAGADQRLDAIFSAAKYDLASSFRKAGAFLLPGSFVVGPAGGDLHYAATLPIKASPAAHECTLAGEVAGLPGVRVVDGAALPKLPAKAHTLTIMANADRIARAMQIKNGC